MKNTNYYHCAECDKYYHSDYWWLYHCESKHPDNYTLASGGGGKGVVKA